MSSRPASRSAGPLEPPPDERPGAPTPAAETPARKGPRQPAVPEIDGPPGPEPTRYGDWEKGGRCSDF
jgi:hypothetical protein